jgi:hypothetical protein
MSGEVFDLRFFALGSDDHYATFRRRRSAELVYEPLDALIVGGEAAAYRRIIFVRPDGKIKAPPNSYLDGASMCELNLAGRLNRLRSNSLYRPSKKNGSGFSIVSDIYLVNRLSI